MTLVRHEPGPVSIDNFRKPLTVRARVAWATIRCLRCRRTASIDMWVPETVYDLLPKEYHEPVERLMLDFLRSQGEQAREDMSDPPGDEPESVVYPLCEPRKPGEWTPPEQETP